MRPEATAHKRQRSLNRLFVCVCASAFVVVVVVFVCGGSIDSCLWVRFCVLMMMLFDAVALGNVRQMFV